MANSEVKSRVLSCAAMLLLGGVVGFAQVPLGPDFQVNTDTTGYQQSPDVRIQSDGSFVVVWSGGLDTDRGIRGQRFDADGVPLDSEFQVHVPPATYRNTEARVAISSAGGEFMVAWREYLDPLDGEIKARLFSPTGTPLGSTFQVNTYVTSDQRQPAVGARDGGFVVAWTSYGSPGTDTLGGSVQARLFDSAGQPLGDQFQVNEFTIRTQNVPAAATSPDGGFVLAWGGGTESLSVEAKRFDSSGSPLGPQFQVSDPAVDEKKLSHSALAVGADGGFIVAWRKNLFSANWANKVQVLGPCNERLGTFVIDMHSPYGGRQGIAAAVNPVSDEFLVVSQRSFTVQGNWASKTGVPRQGDLVLNSFTPGGKRLARVDIDSDGDMVVVWQNSESPETDDDGTSILGRRFRGSFVFVDGFESGDTSAWSSTVP